MMRPAQAVSDPGTDIEIALIEERADLHGGFTAQHQLAPIGLDRDTQDEARFTRIVSQRIIDDLGEAGHGPKFLARQKRATARCLKHANMMAAGAVAVALGVEIEEIFARHVDAAAIDNGGADKAYKDMIRPLHLEEGDIGQQGAYCTWRKGAARRHKRAGLLLQRAERLRKLAGLGSDESLKLAFRGLGKHKSNLARGAKCAVKAARFSQLIIKQSEAG
ncbi:MAG TPA: hypothetical protein VEH07_02665 [Alphaproteobacteria bacterium]|nr:hypothetical protein [Alphaproteobacteria bacterium]